MSKAVACKSCGGDGLKTFQEECPDCEGRGKVPLLRDDGKFLKGPDYRPADLLTALEREREREPKVIDRYRSAGGV